MQRVPIISFLEVYLKKIVKHPNDVSVTMTKGDKSDYTLCIQVSNEDVGKVIGKNGKMVSALKNVISACKAKDNISYDLVVVAKT